MLKMKSACERCNHALDPMSTAFVCSYECTFCLSCTEAMNTVCPNCDGELVRRPTRKRKPLDVATSLAGKKLKTLFSKTQ